jgi:hypothetical protein
VRTSPYRFLVPLAWVVAAAGACSSSSSPPPELGDCTRIGDASCGGPLTGGGGGGGPGGDSGASDGASGAETSGSCGAAENALGTQNPTCVPCVESSCCGSDGACSAQGGVGGCLALVQCMIGCGSSTTCQDTCSSAASQIAFTPYGDFQSCLTGQCPGCPVLPTPNTGGDL